MGESHFVAMKLVMLSCLLVIAAYAAPATFVERDSLVPEEILLQNYNSVADLQAQFGQLKAKLADSSQSTPGVKAAIDNMITMVGTINTAIKEAHKADQGVLDSKMTIIKNLDEAFTVDLKTVNDAAKVAQNLIAKQQREAAAWEKSVNVFTKTQKSYLKTFKVMEGVCCERDNAAVVDLQYVPAYKECDYTRPQTCAADAREVVSSVVDDVFEKGLELYLQLKGKCSVQVTKTKSLKKSTDDTIEACQENKRTSKIAHNLAGEHQRGAEAAWEQTVPTYKKSYDNRLGLYNKEKKKVEAAEVDRKSEWSAVAQIRCLLQSYEKKGTIDKQAEASCTAKESHVSSGKLNINYPAVIAKQNPVENKFAKRTVTDAYYDTCNQRTEPVKRTSVPRKVNDTPKCDSNHKLQNFKL